MERERMINLIVRDYQNYAVDCFQYNYGDDWTSAELIEDVKGFKETLKKYTDDQLEELL